jgi:glycosyltransferase involved in cell wall biosynthesis
VRDPALFVTPVAPYPAVGGGPLRAAALLTYLAQRYDVDLIVFRDPGAPDPRDALPLGLVRRACVIAPAPPAGHPLARALRNADRLARRVTPLVHHFGGHGPAIETFVAGHDYAVTVVGRMWCAPYWAEVAPRSRRTVLDVVDIDSVLFAAGAAFARWPLAAVHRRFSAASRELERRWFGAYSTVLASSPEDDRRIRAICPAADVVVYPNSIPLVPAPSGEDAEVVVFSGSLSYSPNVAAVRFFRDEIWPRLRARWPGLVWRVVGRNPEFVARHVRDDPRIQLSGAVPDAIAELARARVAVVPILVGSSTRVKILEAWAAGRAVVSTRIGAEGLSARDGDNLLLADEPAQFADAVSAVLASADLRARIGRSGRATFEAAYSWPAAWGQLRDSGRL